MFQYKVTYGSGVIEIVRADSPKQAYERSIKGIVAHIKFIR